MYKWILLVIVIMVVIALVLGYFFIKGPDLSKYEYLKEPQISKKDNQIMLVVEVKGDPNVVGGKAFGTLFQTFYKLKNNPKSIHVAPRARWPISPDTPKNSWVGRYGLPVSETAQFPDDFKPGDPNLKIELQNWEYGEVAEILHIGPYSEETPTINRLHQFIREKGYEITGEHEEEYIKGPGMFGKGNPNQYYTIIRLRVKK